MERGYLYFPIDPRDAGDASCNRSVWTIAWSCLLTVFTCTWVAIHPNAASELEESKVVTIRRIGLMITMFLVPEMVICWALRQSLLATYYAKRYENNPSGIKWSKVHAYFLIMGGFTYYNEQRNLEILTAGEMERLYMEGVIEWPRVNAKRIRDRSKADPLAKFIVIGQTIWFCLQVIARLATKLVVTELEISTFAFAILNLIVYVLWWDKPFDVRSPVIVPGQYSPPAQCGPQPQNGTTSPPPRIDLISEDSISPLSLGSYMHAKLDDIAGTIQHCWSCLSNAPMRVWNVVLCRGSPNSGDTVLPPISTNKKIRWWPYLRGKFSNMRMVLSRADTDGIQDFFAIYLALLYGLFGAPFVTYYVEKGVKPSPSGTTTDRYDTTQAKGRHPLCGWLFNFSHQLVVVGLIGSIFGGVHLIAWGFRFPTVTEMWLWRASSLALIFPPVLFQLRAIITACFDVKMPNVKGWREDFVIWVWILFMLVCAGSYMTARGAISILPIIALRDAPPGAFVSIRWTSLIPHI